ncbi:hypothetical protein HID58_079289 [Brassica napus]|uniref:Uncharacterized protein n=1 Tax=Brassica napus TaxID=3708 RepID=A0ABQ7Y415_BRANA|nr:hypothetical protein HID58_079289 [Brassica napus]
MVISVASSGPIQTATQDNKPVIKLKPMLSNAKETSSFTRRMYGRKVLSSIEKRERNKSHLNESTDNIFLKR